MAVTVLDVRSSSSSSSSLHFPSPDSNLLYVEDSIEVDARDVRANAQAGMAEAVFFSFSNLHQVRIVDY
jgi:hypothetical protein